jgi:NDP-sugar pyrophosphorylase family protein
MGKGNDTDPLKPVDEFNGCSFQTEGGIMMYAVIMAGGSGTRFWPLSREKMPKQLLKIGGEETLIQQTVGRVLPLVTWENVFIVTNQALSDEINAQLTAKFGDPWSMNFILEPEARDMAPALGLSALHLNRVDQDGIMVVLAADHSIRKAGEFLNLLRTACEAAKNDYLVTLGIMPDRPETGYGYIEAGAPLKDVAGTDVRTVEAFVEKPDLLALINLFLLLITLLTLSALRLTMPMRPRTSESPDKVMSGDAIDRASKGNRYYNVNQTHEVRITP